MKANTSLKRMLFIMLIALCPLVVKAGLVLTSGQHFDFEFDSIELTNDVLGVRLAVASFLLADSLTGEEILEFSMFEDNPFQQPILSSRYENEIFIGAGFQVLEGPAPWQDLQGAVRLEVFSGTIELESIDVGVSIGDQDYRQTYSIPEPGSVTLLFTGTGIIYLYRKRKFSNQKLELTVTTPDSHTEFMRTEAHF